MDRIKNHIIGATVLASFAVSTLASASFIDQSRNVPTLNEGNINQTEYNLPDTPKNAVEFDFKLKGYVFGLRMIKASYTGWYDENRYTVYSDLKTSGLGALLKKLEYGLSQREPIQA